MPPEILTQPDNGTAPTGTPAVPAGQGRLQGALDAVTGHDTLVYIALALSVLILWFLARKARKIARSEKPDETLSTVGMLIGLGWSGEAMWVIGTQILHVPIPLLVLLLFVLETQLSVAMIRAKRHHRLHDHPGSYGTTAWIIAGSMSLIAAFASHSFAEALLRIAIPLLVTKTWWDGMVGSGTKKSNGSSSWRWTPRRLLLWLGALEPGERDVETVHRDRLTQTMTNLEFARRYGRESARKRYAKKLARLSLTADDEIIKEVRQRVGRASWFTVTPLVTHPSDGTEKPFNDLAEPVRKQARDAKVVTPPTRRVKASTRAATSGDAGGVDPATQAAQLFLTQEVDSVREAARRIPGASEATVRRRVNEARDAGSDAPAEPSVTQIPEPKPPVLSGINGYHPTPEETTR